MSKPIQLVGASKLLETFALSESDVLRKKTNASAEDAQVVILGDAKKKSNGRNHRESALSADVINGHFQLPCCQRRLVIEIHFSSAGYWRLNYVCNFTCTHSVIVQAV